jgi:hypothetical protein
MAYGNYAPFYRGGYFNPMQTPTMPNMAENQNQFAQPYQAPMQTNSVHMQMQTQPTNDTLLWVLNENEASSYPVAPNNSVVLWDKNNKTFYIKTANAQGIPSMQIYDFTERIENPSKMPAEHTCTCGDKFATKEQLNAVEGKINDILAMYEELKDKQTIKTTKPTKKEVE